MATHSRCCPRKTWHLVRIGLWALVRNGFWFQRHQHYQLNRSDISLPCCRRFFSVYVCRRSCIPFACGFRLSPSARTRSWALYICIFSAPPFLLTINLHRGASDTQPSKFGTCILARSPQESATERAPQAQGPTRWTPPGTPGREPAGTLTHRPSAKPRTPSPPALRGLGPKLQRCDGLLLYIDNRVLEKRCNRI